MLQVTGRPRARLATRRPGRAGSVGLAGVVVLVAMSGCSALRTPVPVTTTAALAAPTSSTTRAPVTWEDEPTGTTAPTSGIPTSTTAAPTLTVTAVPTTTTPTTPTTRTTPTTPATPATTAKAAPPATAAPKVTPKPTPKAKATTPTVTPTVTPKVTPKTTPPPAKTPAPTLPPAPGPAVTGCGNPNPGKVMLTFDDGGPHAASILGILDRYGIKARWFPTGQWANANGPFIARLQADGQLLGNHTYSHPQMFASLGTAELQRQITLGYHPTNVFRFPYGASDATSRALVRSAGYSICGWNIDTNDWRGTSTPSIVATVTGQARAGAVVLMHMSFQTDIDALPTIIDNLRGRGLI